MTRVESITKAVRGYDPLLFAKRDENGVIHVYRKGKEWRTEALGDVKISYLFDNPYRVMSITEDWTLRTKPCEWGVLPILCKIKAMDLWNQGIGVDEIIKDQEKVEQSSERQFRTNLEGFLAEYKSAFAKGTNDINTSLLEKIDKRRIKDGSRK